MSKRMLRLSLSLWLLLVLSCLPHPRAVAGNPSDAVERTPASQAAGNLKDTPRESPSRVTSVAFSPDGMQVLTGSSDTTARLWDTATGRQVRAFTAPSGIITGVAFGVGGQQILTGSLDGRACLWSTTTGTRLHVFDTRHTVSNAALSRDGGVLLTVSLDDLSLWDTRTGRRRLRIVTDDFRSVAALSPDGKRLLYGDEDHGLRLQDLATRRRLFSVKLSRSPTILLFAPGGKQVWAGFDNGEIAQYATSSGRRLHHFPVTRGTVTGMALSPDGKRALIGCDLSLSTFLEPGLAAVSLWDLERGRVIRTFHSKGELRPTAVALSPDGTLALAGAWDNAAHLWDVASGKELREFGAPLPPPDQEAIQLLQAVQARMRTARSLEATTEFLYGQQLEEFYREMRKLEANEAGRRTNSQAKFPLRQSGHVRLRKPDSGSWLIERGEAGRSVVVDTGSEMYVLDYGDRTFSRSSSKGAASSIVGTIGGDAEDRLMLSLFFNPEQLDLKQDFRYAGTRTRDGQEYRVVQLRKDGGEVDNYFINGQNLIAGMEQRNSSGLYLSIWLKELSVGDQLRAAEPAPQIPSGFKERK